VRSHQVIDFLLKDPHFPRSVVHCTDRMAFALARLPTGEAVERHLESFASRVRAIEAHTLATPNLRHEMDRFQSELAGLHEVIERTWLHRHGP